MTQSELYQSHLDRVSRSFAFCIRQLPEPLHDWVGLSYLLCRIVDTVEDSAWPSLEKQLEAFSIFDESLNLPEKAAGLQDWLSSFPSDIPEGEKRLIADARTLLMDLHALPPTVKEIIREIVLSMSLGMQHFCERNKGGNLKLGSLAEVNQYCFFVAGVVGELLAKLVSKVEPRFKISNGSLLRAHHFGLFLQKVNLLKDQVSDEKVGRHLIPSRELVEDSSQLNAAEALDFLLAVPQEQIEFRRFCAWSLFLGMEALSVARDSILAKRVIKVPRQEMQSILEKVEVALADDGALRALFESFNRKLGWPKQSNGTRQTAEFPQWLLKLYRGPLDQKSLVELGVTGV